MTRRPRLYLRSPQYVPLRRTPRQIEREGWLAAAGMVLCLVTVYLLAFLARSTP